MKRIQLHKPRRSSHWATILAIFALVPAIAAHAAPPRLLVISSDGMRADALTPENAPNISAMRARGACACVCLNEMPSVTMTNHACILTGLAADGHGVYLDIELPGFIAKPTLMELASVAGRRCAFLASKTKLKYFARPDSCEFISWDTSSGKMTETLLPLLDAAGPDVFFVHFSEPDSTGHRFGWMSPEYLEAVGRVDEWMGQILNRVQADTSRPTYLILTADHGGMGKNHFLNIPEDREIPWIVAGPGITPGLVIHDTVSILDTLPTALWLAGIPIPDGLPGLVRTEIKSSSPTSRPAADANSSSCAPSVGPPCAILLAFPIIVSSFVRQRVARRSNAMKC